MRPSLFKLICVTGSLFCYAASANITLNATRIIYPATEKEVTVKITNHDKSPVLIQDWIDNGDVNALPENINVPFIITPPMNRVDPGKGQSLRLTYTGDMKRQDRESLYYLNVLEIPPIRKNEANPNHVQVAFRTRVKLFYRPEGLRPDAKTAAEHITWKTTNGKLQAYNDSPYYITLLDVRANKVKAQADMIPPHGNLDVDIKSGASSLVHGDKITYDYINDWGAVKTVETSLQ